MHGSLLLHPIQQMIGTGGGEALPLKDAWDNATVQCPWGGDGLAILPTFLQFLSIEKGSYVPLPTRAHAHINPHRCPIGALDMDVCQSFVPCLSDVAAKDSLLNSGWQSRGLCIVPQQIPHSVVSPDDHRAVAVCWVVASSVQDLTTLDGAIAMYVCALATRFMQWEAQALTDSMPYLIIG
eukprot:4374841-Amphidinium_carterae.1